MGAQRVSLQALTDVGNFEVSYNFLQIIYFFPSFSCSLPSIFSLSFGFSLSFPLFFLPPFWGLVCLSLIHCFSSTLGLEVTLFSHLDSSDSWRTPISNEGVITLSSANSTDRAGDEYFPPPSPIFGWKKSKSFLWKKRSSAIQLKAGQGILHKLTIETLRCGFHSTLKGVHNAMAVSNHRNSVPKSSFVFTGIHSEQVQQVALNLPSYRGQLI